MRRVVLAAVAVAATMSGAQAALAEPDPESVLCVTLVPRPPDRLPRQICIGESGSICVQGRDRICIPPE